MSDAALIASLRDELDEARETIRQLRAPHLPARLILYRDWRATRTDAALLKALSDGKPHSTAEIRHDLDAVFGRMEAVTDKAVNNAFQRLRVKLRGLAGTAITIENHYGSNSMSLISIAALATHEVALVVAWPGLKARRRT